jgi:LPXTG-site transpeptidase (sortase) family protein
VALAGFVAAAVLCAGGVSMAVFGLASGTRTDVGATVIPASVATALPRLSHVHGVRALARSVPVSVRIPAIGVSAPVMKLGKNPDGTVQVPPLADHNLTGWYQYGPAPGQPGPAVILGHVDSATGISVFYHLKDLRRGDRIYVTLADEKVTAFAVDGVQKAAKDAFPTAAVYAEGDYPALRLITCGGPFDPTTGHYLDNIVIYAHMIVLRAPNPPGCPLRCLARWWGMAGEFWSSGMAIRRAMSSCAIPATVRGATVHRPA